MSSSDKKAILQKVIEGKSSKEDARQSVEWVSSTVEGQQALSEMIDHDASLPEDELLNDQMSPVQSKMIFSNINRQIKRKHIRKIMLTVAAIVFPLVLLFGWVVYTNPDASLLGTPSYAQIYVPRGENAHILFQDGSEAFLNADTRLQYPKQFGFFKRQVYIEGEAYFKISPAKKRPFIVHAGNACVKVLGTSFNVKAYENDEEIQVVLDQGKIEFNTDSNRYMLLPGQQLIYNKISGKSAIQYLPKSTNISLWKNNIIYFHDAPLAEVLRTLERSYDVTFEIKNPKALQYSYTITTNQTTITEVLGELQKISPIKFTFREDKIVVTLR
jgi:ferric-dicitrate binding protein FerR (iron transport regulator)